MQMKTLGVDVDRITVVDQVPADAVVSLGDGSVDMACIFGGNATKAAREHGKDLMSGQEMTDAGIICWWCIRNAGKSGNGRLLSCY